MTVQIQCSEALMLVPLYKIDDPDDAREREGYLGDIGKDLYKLLAEEYAATHKRSSVSAEKFRIAVKQVAESHRESGEVATWGKYFLSRYPRLAQRIWDEKAANSGGAPR